MSVHSAEGEDRSSFQQVVPWTADDFGFVKATEATGWVDPKFAANWANLHQEGKHRGAYHFFHPEMDAAEQANFFMSVVRKQGLEPGDMLVIDSEILSGADGALEFSSPNGTQRSNVPVVGALASSSLVGSGTLTFLQTVASLAGKSNPVLVYTNLSVAALLGSCTDFDLWIAYPADSAPESVAPWPHWRFWQWSFGGGEGGGDRDAYNGTQQELNAWLSTFTSQQAQPSPPVSVISPSDPVSAPQPIPPA
jgi:GH25 family lysozyme M1 (1,4-beta-N-acetylmuramidase)